MDRAAFVQMATTESTHWWFVGRRAVLEALVDSIDLPRSGAILEAGCGTGGNLSTLSRRGQISAFEPHIDALTIARTRHPGVDILEGALPDELPYPPASFDLVAALDVLEHVRDDVGSARALVELTKPGGWLLVTVPAHQALWGSHDRRLHHMRRYGRRQVLDLFESDDVEIVRVTPFNVVLAPIAMLYRIAERVARLNLGNQERTPPRLVNAILARAFSMEAQLVRRGVSLPFGLSYAVVLRRRTPVETRVL